MGSKSKSSRGRRGVMRKSMHHLPMGKMGGTKADVRKKPLSMKFQNPKV